MAADGDAPIRVDTRSQLDADSVPEPTRPGRSALDYLLRSCDLATRALAWRLLGDDDLDDVLLGAYGQAHQLLGRATSSEVALHLHRSPVRTGTNEAAEQLRRVLIETCAARVASGRPPTGESVPATSVTGTETGPDQDAELRTAWRNLPADQRLALSLAFHERCTLETIAALLSSTPASVDRLIRDARLALLDALDLEVPAGPGGPAGNRAEALIASVILRVKKIDPPRHRDDFWERVDRRLDRLDRRTAVPGDPPPVKRNPDQSRRRRRVAALPVAGVLVTASLVGFGLVAALGRSPGPSLEPADGADGGDPGPGDPDGGGPAADGACVDPPIGWAAWESGSTAPNEGDEAYIEIFVIDDGDESCQVTVEVTADVWPWEDYMVSPYVELGGQRQLIHDGPLGYTFDNRPLTAVLHFDKPSEPTGWVVGYEDYVHLDGDQAVGYIFDPDAAGAGQTAATGMGPEASPPLTELE